MNQKRLKRFIKKNKVIHTLLYPFILVRRWVLNRRLKNLHAVFERIFARVESRVVTVNMPDYFGVFDMDVRSHVFRTIALFDGYETDIRELLLQNLDPAKDVIDVGANIGLFTILMAKQIAPGKKVLAVEPTPGALQLLHSNIHKNRAADSVIVFEGVAGNSNKPAFINFVEGNEEYSTLGNEIVHEAMKETRSTRVQVDCNTLDVLVEKYGLNPGLIKIDVEGAELMVLEGAKATLQKYHPVVIFECFDKLMANFAVSFKDIKNYFAGVGYRVTALEDKNEYIAEYLNQ